MEPLISISSEGFNNLRFGDTLLQFSNDPSNDLITRSLTAIALTAVAASGAQLDASDFKLTQSAYNSVIARLDTILPIVTVSGLAQTM